jgi:hemolysin III
VVQPTAAQRPALDELRAASAKAIDMLKAGCPNDLPSIPTGRLGAMESRLQVMLARAGLAGRQTFCTLQSRPAFIGLVHRAIASVLIYAAGLAAMLGFSAAYNMWPVSHTKWILRRFDHSSIYLLIAGTYTPFIAQLKISIASAGLLTGVWLAAGVGVVLKLVLPGRFDHVAVVLYLLLGWSGVIAYWSVIASLPSLTFWLFAVGGVVYSMGVIFHLWRSLRFQNAIWHAFVLLAAVCHYAAVLEYAVLVGA